jgi:hypothetical protein
MALILVGTAWAFAVELASRRQMSLALIAAMAAVLTSRHEPRWAAGPLTIVLAFQVLEAAHARGAGAPGGGDRCSMPTEMRLLAIPCCRGRSAAGIALGGVFAALWQLAASLLRPYRSLPSRSPASGQFHLAL